MKLLFDADMLIYRFCCACQEDSPFNKELVLKACPTETWDTIQMRVKQCVELASAHFDESIEVVMVLSPKEKTFRYDLFPEYKANRKDIVKPVLLSEMYKKIQKEYHTEIWDNLEADDVLGVLADQGNTCIVSNDKDLKQIETNHMSLSEPEFIEYSYYGEQFFLKQCIAGDSTDGYYGVPGIGMKKAEKILNAKGWTWDTVVSCYTEAMSPKTKNGKKVESVNLGLTEEDALLNARMAYILKEKEEYNSEAGTVNYWTPDTWTGWIEL